MIFFGGTGDNEDGIPTFGKYDTCVRVGRLILEVLRAEIEKDNGAPLICSAIVRGEISLLTINI